MDLQQLTAFFMWCTIINGGLFVIAIVYLVLAPDSVYRMQSKWLPIPRETFNVTMYSFIGLFKLGLLVLNVVPYLALLIIA